MLNLKGVYHIDKESKVNQPGQALHRVRTCVRSSNTAQQNYNIRKLRLAVHSWDIA